MGGLSHTVSGDIASFRTPSRVPIESLKFHFLPKQAAGTPSPENPIPIEGWTGLNGRRAGKNLFNYNKNNFALEDCINSSGNTINRQVYHTGFKNGVFTLSAHIKEGYSRPSYSLVNIGICENDINAIAQSFIGSTESDKTITLNSNQELVLVSTSDSLYSADNSFNKYDIQIEIGSNATDYKPYSGELIPITFPNSETIYGGYVDPVVGEIVAEYAYKLCDGSETWNSNSQNETNIRVHATPGNLGLPKPINRSTSFAKFSYFNPSTANVSWNGFIGSTGNVLLFVPKTVAETVSQWREYLSEHPLQICYKLETPIHIPIAPQDLKAFLDHNNFWSDANDITEVTYAVTESKDILDARKLIMDGSQPHLEDAIGTIASFSTDIKAPVKELKVHFTPVQEGTGNPNKDNVRPLHGFTGITVYNDGKNLIDKDALDGTDKVWWKGGITSGFPEHCVTPLIPVKPGASYYLYRKSTNSSNQSGQVYVCYFGKGGRSEYIGQESWQDIGVGNPHVIPDNVYYIGITVGTSYKDTAYLQLNDLPHEYADYVDGAIIPIEFPATKNLFRCIESEVINSGWNRYIPNPIKQAGTYTISCTYDGDFGGTGYKGVAFAFTDSSYQRVGNLICGYEFGAGTSRKRTFTVTSEQAQAPYIGIWPNSNGLSYSDIVNSIQIEAGSYATGFEPYGTAWGGYIDLIRGKFVAEYYRGIVFAAAGKQGNFFYSVTNYIGMPAIEDTNAGLHADRLPNNPNVAESATNQSITIYHNQIMRWIEEDYIESSLSEYNAYLKENPFEIVYKVKNPIEYDLTPQQLKTLKGLNNIWSDANGAIDVKYWTH